MLRRKSLSRSARRESVPVPNGLGSECAEDEGVGLSVGWQEAVVEAAESGLGALVTERIYAVGGQAAVYVDSSVVADVAAGVTGSGIPMRRDHLHKGFCILKPLPFLVLAGVVEGAGFSADDPLDEMAEMPAWCPTGLTVRSLGSHEAGLGGVSGREWFLTRPSNRTALLARVGEDREPAYSDWVAPLVADFAIEALTGVRAADYCTEVLLEPRGLAEGVVFSRPGEGMPGGARLQCAVTGLPRRAVPMLATRLFEPGTASFAAGGIMSMAGVAGFFAAVGEVMGGKPVNGLPSPDLLADLTAPEHLAYKTTSRRYAQWGAGLIHDLAHVNISKIAGAGSVGHMGGVSGGTAVFDPTRNASVAVFVNGASGSFGEMEMMRVAPVDKVLNAIPTNAERGAA